MTSETIGPYSKVIDADFKKSADNLLLYVLDKLPLEKRYGKRHRYLRGKNGEQPDVKVKGVFENCSKSGIVSKVFSIDFGGERRNVSVERKYYGGLSGQNNIRINIFDPFLDNKANLGKEYSHPFSSFTIHLFTHPDDKTQVYSINVLAEDVTEKGLTIFSGQPIEFHELRTTLEGYIRELSETISVKRRK